MVDIPPRGDARLDPARLAAAHDTGRLHSRADEVLDALSQRVALALRIPVAFVSLIDESRDVYPGQSGFGPDLAANREYAGRTFCHLTLAAGAAVVIADTHVDPSHRAIPIVTTLGVRAYLGIPLMVGAHMVGSLCAIDVTPREWSEADMDLMFAMADEAMHQLTLG